MLRSGSTVGHYALSELAGSGSTAVVYRARDSRLGREVALKLIGPQLSADPVVRERVNREARLAASVAHPNVITVYEAGEHDGTIFMATQWVDGITLRKLVDRDAPLPIDRVARLLVQVARALQAVHDADLIHRDVTPGNVIVDEHDHAYLSDFGITRHTTDVTGLTAPDALVGTLDYVAPEHIEGAALTRSADIYSLGCLGWFLLCGEPPFPRDGHAAKLYAHLAAEYEPAANRRDDVPAALDLVLSRAMSKDPSQRPESAAAFAAAMAEAVAGDDAAADRASRFTRPAVQPSEPAASVPAPASSPRRRRRDVLAAVAVAVVLIGAPIAFRLGLHPGDAGLKTLQLRHGAVAIGGGPDRVLVAGGRSDSITSIAADGSQRVTTLGSSADRVAADAGHIYVTGGRALTVLPAGSGLSRRFRLPAPATALTAGPDGAWLALAGRPELVHATGATTHAVAVSRRVSALAGAGAVLWAIEPDVRGVQRFDARTGRALGQAVTVAQRPLAIALSGDVPWILDAGRNVAVRLDPRTGRPVGAPVPVPRGPVGIAADARNVWVVSAPANQATRIDARSGRPAQTEGVAPHPSAIELARGEAWVTSAGGRVTRVPVR